MIIVTQWEAIALIVIVLVGFLGFLLMCEANGRRIKLLRYLLNEHDKRLRTLEREAGITNWTSDLQE